MTSEQTKPTTPTDQSSQSRLALVRLRAGLRRVAIFEVVAAGAGMILAGLLAEGLLDYLLRLPAWLRIAVLVIAIVLITMGVFKKLIPALRLKPKLSTLALRVERTALGQDNKLGGVLASGVALADQQADTGEPESIGWLRRAAAGNADQASKGASLNSLIHTGTLRHNIFGLLLALVAVGAISFMAPKTARTGAMRTLMPWSDASWPKRTEIADVTQTEPHALGSALPLRALVTRTNRPVGMTNVEVVYRVVSETSTSEFRAEPMTGQEMFEMLPDGSSGEAYERLIEPNITIADNAKPATLEFYFRTPDDRTDTQRVLLVEPPRVVSMSATIVPPEYAPTSEATSTWIAGESDLGDGQDERAVLGPVLFGSKITVDVTLNKPAKIEGTPFETAGDQPSDFAMTSEANTHTIAWTAGSRGRLRLHLEDELGITSVDDAFVRLETLEDKKPSVTVTVPERDEAVLASAVVDLVGEARDDVGLKRLSLRTQIAKVPASVGESTGALPEAVGEPELLAAIETSDVKAEISESLDLATFDLTVGDAVLVTAVAVDVFALPTAGGGFTTHEEAVSAVRTLHIISDTELVDQILAELGGIRRTAVRLSEQQTELIEKLRESKQEGLRPEQSLARDQASLTDALDRLSQTTQQLRERTERNGLDNATLEDLLNRAQHTIDDAGDESEQAAAELNTASQEENEQAETNAEESQQRVRRAMEDLTLLLDQGKDSWAVRQALEGLMQDQQQLAQQTAELGEQTVGKNASQLTQEELTELDRIAQRQLELASRTSDLLDELDDRSQEMQETDPGQASAMRSAARRGREQGVPQSLQEAAQNVQNNNTAEAGRQQQSAMAQLDQMLEDLEEAEQQRDQELKRALLSLIESIEALVRTQQDELAKLGRETINNGDIPALATGMASLHRNTLSVIDEASGKPETARVAGLLGEAASAEIDAVVALQNNEAQLATRHEELSLSRLESALEEAQEELDNAEQRERERKKEELKAAYTEALETQVALSVETAPLVKDRLSRRDRADARTIGRSEQELREALRQIPANYEEITSAGVFDFAHTRIDSQLDDIGTSFIAGKVTRQHARQQASVESLLRGLIEALEDPENESSPFSEGSGGEGMTSPPGEGQEQELIPALAELRLLRTIQQDLLNQTRMIEEFGSTADEARAMGELQTEVAKQGEVLIEKLQQQGAQQQPQLVPPQPEGESE
ncbi:MAG: hypothetical protein ACIARQ_02425 [Phycisphaerales bacterium JB061]